MVANIKVILFDIDDTLFLTRISKEKVIDKTAELFNIKKTRIAKYVSRLYKVYGFDKDEKVIDHIFSNLLTKTERKQLIEENKNYAKNSMKHVKPIVVNLKSTGLKIGLISNSSFRESIFKIKLLGIERYIDYVITANKISEKRPSKFMFVKAANKFKVQPNEILYVGNDPILDIIWGKYCGMKTLLIKEGMKRRYEILNIYKLFMPNYSLKKLDEIIHFKFN